MSKEFVTIKAEADYKAKQKQEDNGIFEGECILTACHKDFRDKNFFETFARGMFLGIPKDNEIPYVKGLVECCINQLYGAVMAMDKSVPYKSRKTTDEVDIEMLHLLREMSMMLVWISNSTSWKEGKFHFFDAIEIETKLKHLKGMCSFYDKGTEPKEEGTGIEYD